MFSSGLLKKASFLSNFFSLSQYILENKATPFLFKKPNSNTIFGLGLAFGISSLLFLNQNKQFGLLYNHDNSECCGIVGYIGNQKKAGEVCIQGLQILESRGYDSCGIVSIDEAGKFQTTKFASSDRFGGDCIKRMQVEGKGNHDHRIGIGHTRWATHGDKTDINAHPHFDHKKRVALVHNGIIENYHQLKDELKQQYGLIPTSQTDTEIVALYIGTYLDKGLPLMDAISKAVEILEGAYSFVLISTLDPESLYIFKNTGTMVIGVSKELQAPEGAQISHKDKEENNGQQDDKNGHSFQIVASDTSVFQDYTSSFYNIHDKEIIKVSINEKIETHNLKTVMEEKVRIQKPPGIEHYYIMEMLQQPDAVAKALNYGARLMGGKSMVKLGGLEQNEENLMQIENLIIAACGTSFYAAQYAEYLMRELGCFNYIEAKMASEICKEDLQMKNGGFLSVSQSGETMDLLIPFRLAKEQGLTRLNVVNKVMSTLAREENCGVFLNCGRELSVASTKAFISQVVVLTLVSLWFAQRKNFNHTKKQRQCLTQELKFLATNVNKVLENCEEFSKKVAETIKGSQHIFLIGSGLGEIIAKEGCLKIKELTYTHCQYLNLNHLSNNFFNYAIKHPGLPSIFVVLDNEERDEVIEKIKIIVSKIDITPIIITDIKEKSIREYFEQLCQKRVFYAPKSGYLSALLCVIPLQRLAYDLTIALGYDPDKPRNLAKELTTK